MKKYLIRGALALVVCGCMISCQDHDEFVGNVIQAKTQAFDETFVEAYGEIQAGHDWGFGSVGQAIRTRSADTKNNMWYTYEGITIPSPITAAERKAVADLFSEEHREACTVTIDLTNFFIQQVYKGGGMAHIVLGAHQLTERGNRQRKPFLVSGPYNIGRGGMWSRQRLREYSQPRNSCCDGCLDKQQRAPY